MHRDPEFIEAVVRAVLQNMGGEKKRYLPSGCSEEMLVLAPKKSIDFGKIEKRFGCRANLVASDELPRKALADPGNRFSKIIVPVLCPVGMADLALGRASGRELIILLELLLKGYRVEVGEYEYHRYHRTASPQLYKTYQQYEKTLKEYGLTLLTGNTDPKEKKIPTSSRRLVTEKVIVELAAKGVPIELEKGTLVTALARDYAREHGIILKTKK